MDELPECFGSHRTIPEAAQAVTLPVIINGRIGQPGEAEVFKFAGHAGEQIVAEVFARRLDSPLDFVLAADRRQRQTTAFNDDFEDKGTGLNTFHADSYITITLPADGTYYIHLTDIQHQGGDEYAYRLRISEPRPDFALRVVPSSISVRAGGAAALTAYAIRRDGFSGEIALSLKDAPAGFAVEGAKVPAGQDQVRFTLTAPASAPKGPVSLSMEGLATIDGQDIHRPAVPAEDMMQAFAYRHLVPSSELLVAVVGRAVARGMLTLVETGPIRIPAGGTARFHVRAPATTLFGDVQLELNDPPAGLTIQSISSSGGTAEIVLKGDSSRLKPGLKGNLILDAFIERTPPAASGKPAAPQTAHAAGTVPAIPFEVVPQ